MDKKRCGSIVTESDIQEGVTEFIETKNANRTEERSVWKDGITRSSINGGSEKSISLERMLNESTLDEMRKNIVEEEFIGSEDYRKAIEKTSAQAYDIYDMNNSASTEQPVKKKVYRKLLTHIMALNILLFSG